MRIVCWYKIDTISRKHTWNDVCLSLARLGIDRRTGFHNAGPPWCRAVKRGAVSHAIKRRNNQCPTCSVSRLEWSGVPSTFACTWCMYFYMQIRMCIPMCVGMPASVSPSPSSHLCTLHKHFEPPRSAVLPIPPFWRQSRLLEWARPFPFRSSGDQGWGNKMTVLCDSFRVSPLTMALQSGQ